MVIVFNLIAKQLLYFYGGKKWLLILVSKGVKMQVPMLSEYAKKVFVDKLLLRTYKIYV